MPNHKVKSTKPAAKNGQLSNQKLSRFSWDTVRHLIKNLLSLSQRRNVYQALSEIDVIDKIHILELEFNLNQKTKKKHPLYAAYQFYYQKGKRLTPPDGELTPALLGPKHAIMRAFNDLKNFNPKSLQFYAAGKIAGSSTYYMVVGTTAVGVSFNFDDSSEEARDYIKFILDVTLRLVSGYLLNNTLEAQAAIVGLSRNAAKEYIQQTNFIDILDGNASLLYTNFGFTKIIFAVTGQLRILFDGHLGYIYNYLDKKCGATGQYVYEEMNLNKVKHSELIKLDLGEDNELTILLWAPNYSPVFIRETMQLTTFITNMKTSFESVFRHRLEQLAAKHVAESLRRDSERDFLTRLLNRKGFFSVLKRHLKNNMVFTLIEVDIDNFKNINDTYGHDAGDLVLKSLSSLMNDSFTRNTIVSRFGGEEFYVLIPNLSFDESLRILERFRQNVGNNVVQYQDRKRWGEELISIKYTISAGVGFFIIEKPKDKLEHFFKPSLIHVDQALYKAKQNGKNCIYIFRESGFVRYEPRSRSTDINRRRN